MIELTFKGSTREEVEDAVRRYVGAQSDDTAMLIPDDGPRQQMLAVVSRIRSVVSYDHLMEVARASYDGQFVPFESATREKHHLSDPRAWGGAISGVNRAWHDAGHSGDLIVWNPRFKGYGMSYDHARAVLAATENQTG